jgi:hypothetical protein
MHYPSGGNAQMNQDDKKLKGITCLQTNAYYHYNKGIALLL